MNRWLIVDDDPVFAETLSRSLRRRGDEAVVAEDAASALCALCPQPDRVVLDLRIGMDSGLHLLPELRRRLPAARIVMLTGFGSIATAVRAIRDGADDYLPKPVSLKELQAAFDGHASDPGIGATMSPRRVEWEHIQRILAEEGGNVSRAARRLGMHRRTLQRKLEKKPQEQ